MYGKTHTKKNRKIISEYSKNMVVVRDKSTKEILRVTRDEWKNDTNLEAESKGRKIKDTSKYKHSGSSNPASIIVNIYDNNHNLKFECYGNFSDVCKLNNLPSSALSSSYRNSTIISYCKYTINKAVKMGYDKYQGWYARKI